MQTAPRLTYVFIHAGSKIDLRLSGFQFTPPRWMFAGPELFLAGARREGTLLVVAGSRIYTDLEEALEACLDALEEQGAEAAVAYSSRFSLHANGASSGDHTGLFGLARCIASSYGIHLVDWLLCGEEDPPRSLKEATSACNGRWWDVPG